ncbi:hypothetical protein [Campylobacter concisus]
MILVKLTLSDSALCIVSLQYKILLNIAVDTALASGEKPVKVSLDEI